MLKQIKGRLSSNVFLKNICRGYLFDFLRCYLEYYILLQFSRTQDQFTLEPELWCQPVHTLPSTGTHNITFMFVGKLQKRGSHAVSV